MINIDLPKYADNRRKSLENANMSLLSAIRISKTQVQGVWHAQYKVSLGGKNAKDTIVALRLSATNTEAYCPCGSTCMPCVHIMTALLKEDKERVYSPINQRSQQQQPKEGDVEVVSFRSIFACGRGDMETVSSYHFDDDDVDEVEA